MRGLLERIFARQATYTWEWKRCDVSAVGNIAWIMTDATIHGVYKDGHEETGPYRISGIFKLQNGKWLWVQFHGSEPVAVDE